MQHFIRAIASANVDFIGLLEIPPSTAACAVDSEGQAAFPSGGHLRDGSVGVDLLGKAVMGFSETQQDAAEIFGVHSVGNA